MAARIQEIQKVIFTRIRGFLPSKLDLIIISRKKAILQRTYSERIEARTSSYTWKKGGNYTGIWPSGGITGAIDHMGGKGGGERHRRWPGITRSMEGCDATPSLLTIVPLARSRSYLRFLQVFLYFFPRILFHCLISPRGAFCTWGGEGGGEGSC